ncbi:hypothetical protein [Micromonospora avicenniae]|uniref:hypothetical protein n=1 Tax=Micromonospora avicenniae TaxID=1198245 RepID=UPI00341925E1
MTVVVVFIVVLVVLLVAAFVFVGWRDRERLSSADDSAAARDASAMREQSAAERHAVQGEVWRRGQTPNS